MHVHLREPGIEHAETIETGARAAAAGGFTTICCMPNTLPVNDSATVTSYIVQRAAQVARVNVFPIGAITKGSIGEELAAIGSMREAGIVAISDDGRPVMNARVMRRAMEVARALDLTVIDHCEDLQPQRRRRHARGPGIGAAGTRRHSFRFRRRHGGARPPARRTDRCALPCRASFHVAFHGDGGIRENPRPRCELRSDAAPFRAHRPRAGRLRQQLQNEAAPALQRRCRRLSSMASSPAWSTPSPPTMRPMPAATKCRNSSAARSASPASKPPSASRSPNWCITGRITVNRMVELFTTGPANILRLNRGSLAPGAPADITIFDLDTEWTYDVQQSYSKSRNSPFSGRRFRGGPLATIVGGEIVWKRR